MSGTAYSREGPIAAAMKERMRRARLLIPGNEMTGSGPYSQYMGPDKELAPKIRGRLAADWTSFSSMVMKIPYLAAFNPLLRSDLRSLFKSITGDYLLLNRSFQVNFLLHFDCFLVFPASDLPSTQSKPDESP